MHGSCCVIVGAGPGLGLNIARRFAQGGFNIALISRDQNKLDGLTETLNSEGYIAQGFAADAAIEQELQSAFSRISQWNGDIRALVYNAAAVISDRRIWWWRIKRSTYSQNRQVSCRRHTSD